MPKPGRQPEFSKNRLLAALPRGEYAHFLAQLEPVNLAAGEVLCEAGTHPEDALFITAGLVSLLSMNERGHLVEVGKVGPEGAVGVPTVLTAGRAPFRARVQIPGAALKVEAGLLRSEFGRAGRLQDALLDFTNLLLTQATQSGLCHRFHTLEGRLCRRLLAMSDGAGADHFRLTQDQMAQLLGTGRPKITAVAASLQRKGVITCVRGEVTILDRRELESAACDCYRAVKREVEQYLQALRP